MSSQAPRNGDRYHQDFVARIRYSNALPPPPNPPKLLDIPNTGLASGQYTTPGFASRLAREQPLNIEADAELGMPLDLVGMPGVFDGDESSIQAPSHPPQVHPHDRVLLRPLATLGKPQVSGSAVSFLRRTEYISNANTTNRASLFHKSQKGNNAAASRPQKRKSPEPEAGTPEHMKRRIVRGFESARENLKNPKAVKHPSKFFGGKNKGLHVVEAFPVLPDTTAFPDSGTYVTYKFAHPPLTHGRDGYDRRLQTSVLKYVGRTPEEEEAYQNALEAHQRDPASVPKPLNQHHYELYLAESVGVAEKMRAKFDLNNPDRDANESAHAYSYSWARSYLATTEYEMEHDAKYDEEIAFAVDPETKTAWYYPSMLRNRMEPPRRIYTSDEHGSRSVDVQTYEFAPVGPSEEFRARMDHFRENPRFAVEEEEEEEAEADQTQAQATSPDASGSPVREQSVGSDGYRREDSQERREESEPDAEGDEDE